MAAGLMGFAQMAGATAAGVLLSLSQDGSALPMLVIPSAFALLGLAAFRLTLRVGPATPLPVAF